MKKNCLRLNDKVSNISLHANGVKIYQFKQKQIH